MMYTIELQVWFGTTNWHIGFWATKKLSLPFVPFSGLKIRLTKDLESWVEACYGLDFTINEVLFNVDSGEFSCEAQPHEYLLNDAILETLTEEADLIEKAGFLVEREGDLRRDSAEDSHVTTDASAHKTQNTPK